MIEADQIREENRRLKHELQEQRTYFHRQNADLKAARAKAVDQHKDALAKMRLITRQRDTAERMLAHQLASEPRRSTASHGTVAHQDSREYLRPAT